LKFIQNLHKRKFHSQVANIVILNKL